MILETSEYLTGTKIQSWVLVTFNPDLGYHVQIREASGNYYDRGHDWKCDADSTRDPDRDQDSESVSETESTHTQK